MTTALVKAEGAKMARGGKRAKRETKVAERRHEARKMKVSTSMHKTGHTTLKHGNVKLGRKRTSKRAA